MSVEVTRAIVWRKYRQIVKTSEEIRERGKRILRTPRHILIVFHPISKNSPHKMPERPQRHDLHHGVRHCLDETLVELMVQENHAGLWNREVADQLTLVQEIVAHP